MPLKRRQEVARARYEFWQSKLRIIGKELATPPSKKPKIHALSPSKLDQPKKLDSRFLLVQEVINQFWKVWMKLYFPTLLLKQK